MGGISVIPSCPHGMHIHSLCNIDDQFYVCVVVIICASGDFDVLVGHADIICIGLQVLGGGHHGELDGTLVSKGLVGPFSHGTDFFDRGNAVIGNQDLRTTPLVTGPAFPLAAALTDVMTEWPSCAATKSFTLLGGATSRLLPPMKCEGRLCFAAYALG